MDIARGQNTGISVQPRSIFELDGAFDSLKEIVKDQDWANDIGFKESDKKDIDVRELVSVLELMNVTDFPVRELKHPIAAYEKWSTPLMKYGDDFKEHQKTGKPRKYAAFEPLLIDTLVLYDHIRREFLKVYNETVKGRAGNLRIVEKAPPGKGRYEFRYAKLDDHDQRLTKGAAYPILGAFRNFVSINPDTGCAEWVGGFENILSSWRDLAPELVSEAKQAISDIGNAPDSLGKNRNHWTNLLSRCGCMSCSSNWTR